MQVVTTTYTYGGDPRAVAKGVARVSSVLVALRGGLRGLGSAVVGVGLICDSPTSPRGQPRGGRVVSRVSLCEARPITRGRCVCPGVLGVVLVGTDIGRASARGRVARGPICQVGTALGSSRWCRGPAAPAWEAEGLVSHEVRAVRIWCSGRAGVSSPPIGSSSWSVRACAGFLGVGVPTGGLTICMRSCCCI